MDVEDPTGDLVDGLACHHRLDQRLEKDRGVGADDVGPEEGAGGGVGQQLDEARGVLEGPLDCRGDLGQRALLS